MNNQNIDKFINSIIISDYKTYIDIGNIKFTRILDRSFLYYTDTKLLIEQFKFKPKTKYPCNWIVSLKGVPTIIKAGRSNYPIILLDDVINWIEKMFIVRINSTFNITTNLWDCEIRFKHSGIKLTEKKGFKYKEGSIVYCIKLLLED